MKKAFILARREMAGYFFSPMAYVIGALFLLSSGLWFFHRIFVPGHEASLRPLFDAMGYIMIFAVPLLTMRSVSEEFRSGTIETLMTAPVTDAEVIGGKFLGVMSFYLALLACTGVFMVLMGLYGQPDPGVALTGYIRGGGDFHLDADAVSAGSGDGGDGDSGGLHDPDAGSGRPRARTAQLRRGEAQRDDVLQGLLPRRARHARGGVLRQRHGAVPVP